MSEFKIEFDRKKIEQFLSLLERKLDLNRYNKPVLSYRTDDDAVYYTVWEEEILERLGFNNVSGHDYKDPIFFCPDWVTGKDVEDDLDDIDDDDLFDDLDDL